MKKFKSPLFVIALCVALIVSSSVAKADSWTDFSASMNNSSALHGSGVSSNSSSFSANGGASDQGGLSAFSTAGNMGGVTKGNHGQGSAKESVSVGVSAVQSPDLSAATTHSTASVSTSGSGCTTSSGHAGVSATVVSVTQHGSQTPTP